MEHLFAASEQFLTNIEISWNIHEVFLQYSSLNFYFLFYIFFEVIVMVKSL